MITMCIFFYVNFSMLSTHSTSNPHQHHPPNWHTHFILSNNLKVPFKISCILSLALSLYVYVCVCVIESVANNDFVDEAPLYLCLWCCLLAHQHLNRAPLIVDNNNNVCVWLCSALFNFYLCFSLLFVITLLQMHVCIWYIWVEWNVIWNAASFSWFATFEMHSQL